MENSCQKFDYQRYMRSAAWKRKRRQVLERADGKCERWNCHREPTEVHHKTYKRLGDERLSDLEAVCWHCHTDEHPERVGYVQKAVYEAKERLEAKYGPAMAIMLTNLCFERKPPQRASKAKKPQKPKKRRVKRKPQVFTDLTSHPWRYANQKVRNATTVV